MTLQVADRVQETFTTTGTGPVSLLGAVTGYQAFSAACANADTCYYAATDGTNWEVGLGTYTSAGNTLTRTTILSSSNSNAAVSWAAGTKNIWLDMPAAQIIKSLTTTGTGAASLSGGVLNIPTPGASPIAHAYTGAASPQAMSAAALLQFAHGMGVLPSRANYWIVFTTAAAGYSIGDVVAVASNHNDGSTNRGITVYIDTTNVNIRCGSDGTNSFFLLNKGTGVATVVPFSDLSVYPCVDA